MELICSFGSAHERAATFHDCRRGILPKILTCENTLLYDVGKLILSCTKNDVNKRPTASDIAQLDLFSDTKIAEIREIEVKKLESELKECQELVEAQRSTLLEKDELIKALQVQLEKAAKYQNND